jgi:hypothetical protein
MPQATPSLPLGIDFSSTMLYTKYDRRINSKLMWDKPEPNALSLSGSGVRRELEKADCDARMRASLAKPRTPSAVLVGPNLSNPERSQWALCQLEFPDLTGGVIVTPGIYDIFDSH